MSYLAPLSPSWRHSQRLTAVTNDLPGARKHPLTAAEQKLVGAYWLGTALAGATLNLRPDGRFTFAAYRLGDPVIPPKRPQRWGSWRLDAGVLRLTIVRFPHVRRHFLTGRIRYSGVHRLWPAETVVPFRWGARQYLLPEDQAGLFVKMVRASEGPDRGAGFPYLREGDERQRVVGLPDLPNPWASEIHARA